MALIVCSTSAVQAQTNFTLHLIGDSTMAEYDEGTTDKRGWGMMFQQFFTSEVTINNRAKSGASSKSFYLEAPYWTTVKQQIQPGDYVLIQFAHNDEKNDGLDGGTDPNNPINGDDYRGTSAQGTYKEYLRYYIDETISLGATPILATAISRKYFNGSTITRKGRHDLGDDYGVPVSDNTYDYSVAMEEVAVEKNVELIDLTNLTKDLLESYGEAESTAQLFVSSDSTHPNALGATLVARLCAQDMTAQNILATYINTAADVLINPNDVDFGDAYTGQVITEELTITGFDLDPAAGTFTLSVSDGFLIAEDISDTFTSSITMNYSNNNLEFSEFYISVTQSFGGLKEGTLTATNGTVTKEVPLTANFIELTGGTEVNLLWPLLTDDSYVLEGPANPLAESHSNMYVQAYSPPNSSTTWPAESGYDTTRKTQRNLINGGTWPAGEIDENSTRYIEFGVSASAGTELNIDEISMYVGGSGGSGMRCRISYSKDDFSTTSVVEEFASMTSNNMYAVSTNTTITVTDDETLKLRIYPWYSTEATSKTICLADVNIHGIATPVASEPEPEIGETYIYKFNDGSVLPQDDTINYSTFSSTDGFLSIEQGSGNQFRYNDSQHGLVVNSGNNFELAVAGDATITFRTCQYSAGGGTLEFTDESGTILGSIVADNNGAGTFDDKSFDYAGPAGIITATLTASGATYLHELSVANDGEVIPLPEPEAGETYIYKFNDGSVLPQDDTINYSTFSSIDGFMSIEQGSGNQFRYNDSSHGLVVRSGNNFELAVAGDATITFRTCTFSASEGTLEFTDELGTVLGSIVAHNSGAGTFDDKSFDYVGPAGIITATLTASNATYFHELSIANLQEVTSASLPEVWDFGAEQLDPLSYANILDEAAINAWYGSTPAGTTGENTPTSFTAGVLTWTGSTNDRLRTTNTNLTRYDDNVGASGFNGRLYVNSSGPARYLSLNLAEDDEISVWGLSQNGNADMYFEYVPDPSAQTDVAIFQGNSISEINFVAQASGIYRIYGTGFKPSYHRIIRAPAQYSSVTGAVDVTAATGIPSGYEIVFTNAAGKEWSSTVSSGTYQLDLPIGYTYSLSLINANGFVITGNTELDVVSETTIKDITIAGVILNTLSGPINGLGADISNLTLVFTPDSGDTFIPQPVIDVPGNTYTVELEQNVGYTISAEGVNDYEISDNLITLTEDYVSSINFSLKSTYPITLDTGSYDLSTETNISYVFNNINEPDYSYTFTDPSTIVLRDGEYEIVLDGIEQSPIELGSTPNLIVSGAAAIAYLNLTPITVWTFDTEDITNGTAYYKGLGFSGSGSISNQLPQGHLVAQPGSIVTIPVNPGDKVVTSFYYTANFTFNGTGTLISTNSLTTSNIETAEFIYTGIEPGTVTLNMSTATDVADPKTSYFTKIELKIYIPYSPTVTVGLGKDYFTINEALTAISQMARPNDERVTVLIDPGNYEEMLVIDLPNITLKNAAATPSIELTNSGVDIAPNAVRITGYYGHGYNYASMDSNFKWNADVLASNIGTGAITTNNPGAGSATFWNATITISGDGFIAENLIIENSFNQYISLKESQDVLELGSGNKGLRPTAQGDTSVQHRDFVERAAAIGIANNTDKVILDNCRVVGRQDSFYGGSNSRVAVYKGAMMGAVDYIFGAMNATFYQTDLVLNTSEKNGDEAYITAAKQGSGERGFLFYECHIKGTELGVNTAATQGVQSGYFGRPWEANTSEAIFYNTTIDVSTSSQDNGLSLINPEGWRSSLGGESAKMYEFGTIENSGANNESSRVSWATLLTVPTLTDGTDITLFNFTKGNDDWDPFSDLVELEIIIGVDETMTIEGNFKLNSRSHIGISEGGSLTINGNLTNNGQIDLNSISDKYSSIIVNGSSTGNIKYKRHVNAFNGTTGNDLISAPVSNQEFGIFSDNNPNIYENPTSGSEDQKLFGHFDEQSGGYQIYSSIDDNSTIILSGAGYRAARDSSEDATSGTTFIFEGELETGDVTIDLTETTTSAFKGWNLIGNPYASYIDFDAFFALNQTQLDIASYQAIYGYDGNANDGWTVLNSATTNLLIAPGQGFFVKSKPNGGSITFTPAMRRDGNSDDFITSRTTNSHFGHIKLNSASGTDFNYNTDFYFNSNATLGLDPGYDAALYNGNAPSFSIYSQLVENNNGSPFTIQALNPDAMYNVVIPLGVKASQGQEITIGIAESDMPEDINVYLEDTENNTFTLLNTVDYIFTAEANLTGTGRFYLRFEGEALGITKSPFDSLNIFSNKNNKTIVIEGQLTSDTQAKLYDIHGRVILQNNLDTNNTTQVIDVNHLSSGVYIIELDASSNTQRIEKLIIN